MLICCNGNHSFSVDEVDIHGPTEHDQWLLMLNGKTNQHSITFGKKQDCDQAAEHFRAMIRSPTYSTYPGLSLLSLFTGSN